MFMATALLAMHEELAFLSYVQRLPCEARAKAMQDRDEMREKRRIEAIAERRHQELCSAIRLSKY